MRIIDISLPIEREMPVYKGREEKRPTLIRERQMPQDSINESVITMNLHTGTHLDSPLHMKEDGAPMEEMPLERLIVPCQVIDLTGVTDSITLNDLQPFELKKDSFLIIKTQNSFGLAGQEGFIYLSAEAALYLAQKGISGLGIDALGVERDQPGHLTHHILMDHDILILEGLYLKDVEPGPYLLIALPLSIKGAEGSPARAVLVEGHLPKP